MIIFLQNNWEWIVIFCRWFFYIFELVSIRFDYFLNSITTTVEFERRSSEYYFTKTPMLKWDISVLKTANYIRSYHSFTLLWFFLYEKELFLKWKKYEGRMIKIFWIKYIILDVLLVHTILIDLLIFVIIISILLQVFDKVFV